MSDDSPIFGGTPSQQHNQQQVYRQYVGVLALLGRLAHYDRLRPDDQSAVDRAFVDANEIFATRGATLRWRRASPGCYGTFEG
jgi:hypothetical protein